MFIVIQIMKIYEFETMIQCLIDPLLEDCGKKHFYKIGATRNNYMYIKMLLDQYALTESKSDVFCSQQTMYTYNLIFIICVWNKTNFTLLSFQPKLRSSRAKCVEINQVVSIMGSLHAKAAKDFLDDHKAQL